MPSTDATHRHQAPTATGHSAQRRSTQPLGADLSSTTPLTADDSATDPDEPWTPHYSPWRHGGWYIDNVRYPSGAVGCVSRNYPDRKWRIVCDRRDGEHTYPSRDAAARAERDLAANTCPSSVDRHFCDLPRGHAPLHVSFTFCLTWNDDVADGSHDPVPASGTFDAARPAPGR